MSDDTLNKALFEFLCRMGDNTLVLGHRVSEWCGHAPVLEEDIALANMSLDLIGQTQLWLGLAGELEGAGRSADDLAYLRDAFDFRNLLLVELPNGDFGKTLMRQFLFDGFQSLILTELTRSSNERVKEIALKVKKEVTYHLERSSDLVVRLGDGNEESHRRMQQALNELWPYVGEMFIDEPEDKLLSEAAIAPLPSSLKARWETLMRPYFAQAKLNVPDEGYAHKGGKHGTHSEHLGFILAEMQFLQRAYPGSTW
ncbi:1,2-phenylacetyl-CoA epoxidase subunit PaaC [Polycladidibacter stylochi]|uniref:1,2-phenylacetyl-CoA epoxidase subunit PaaC n=1 Tax=Polycladidibacter stylochi TaxID=1807766 RepID=UPI000833DC93|nr:1,2-phenylacetyl-CoA epoxidase subunit PaaC [Pseudovibrio stylochi]